MLKDFVSIVTYKNKPVYATRDRKKAETFIRIQIDMKIFETKQQGDDFDCSEDLLRQIDHESLQYEIFTVNITKYDHIPIPVGDDIEAPYNLIMELLLKYEN